MQVVGTEIEWELSCCASRSAKGASKRMTVRTNSNPPIPLGHMHRPISTPAGRNGGSAPRSSHGIITVYDRLRDFPRAKERHEGRRRPRVSSSGPILNGVDPVSVGTSRRSSGRGTGAMGSGYTSIN